MNQKQYLIGSISVGLVALAFVIPAIIMMANSSFTKTLVLNTFNWGLILLAVGVSILFGLVITLPPLINNKKLQQVNNEA